MKLRKTEVLILGLTLSFLMLCAGYFWGRDSAGESFVIEVQNGEEALPIQADAAAGLSEAVEQAEKTDSVISKRSADDAETEPVVSAAPSPEPPAEPDAEAAPEASPSPEPAPEASAEPSPEPEPTDEPAEEEPLMVNVNTADIGELTLLPGIGEVLAQRILELREEYGGFAYIDELLDVPGIGVKKLEDIRQYICLEDISDGEATGG